MENKIITRKDSIRTFTEYARNLSFVNTNYRFLKDVLNFPSIISIVARPQWGKTLLKDQLCMDLYYQNRNNQDINTKIKGWLDFQLEMPIYEKIKRELKFMGVDTLNLKDIENKVKMLPDENWSTITEIRSISELEYYAMKEYTETGKNLISVDHALIITKAGTEMQSLFEALVTLKKNGIYSIVLSQLRRDIGSDERCKNGSNKAKIYESDIYNSDILMQYSDIVIYIDRPDLRNINIYSSAKIPFSDKECIIGMLKNRFGELKHYKYKINNNLLFELIEEIDFNKRYNTELPENDNFVNEKTQEENGIFDNQDIEIDF